MARRRLSCDLQTTAVLATQRQIFNRQSKSDVVAVAVKNLANQAKQIEHVNEFVILTAAAMEERSTVTGDMSDNMQRAASKLA